RMDGRPFYAMRFIHGDSLEKAIRAFHASATAANPLELRQLLRRFVDMCNAIAYAHSQGVLHRDLKPDNVMLRKFGESLVVDWGLARVTGGEEAAGPAGAPGAGDADATRAGSVLGTPVYMSPEQAAGKVDELGPASDVYSLGATLYHLLAGKVPF